MKTSNGFRASSYAIMLVIWAILGIFEMAGARAIDVNTVPGYVNTYLFGGTQLVAAQILVCALVIFAFVIPLTIFKVDFKIQVILIIVIIGFLTAIQWLAVGVFVIILVVIALIFASKATDIIWSRGT